MQLYVYVLDSFDQPVALVEVLCFGLDVGGISIYFRV